MDDWRNVTYNPISSEEGKYFCPRGSNKLCSLSQICCSSNNETFCCNDSKLKYYGWLVATTIIVLFLIDMVIGMKVYHRWLKSLEKWNDLNSIQSAKSPQRPNHLKSICIKPIDTNIDNASTILANHNSVKT
ncbi:hypothetical protein BLOT_000569 [Blomia tropicalis]|nr:hypothetical protein BLOT_000569 [Blomia tropicalis]